MSVSRDDVIAAYEMILGRPPESEEVIDLHAGTHSDRMALGAALLTSPEGQSRAGRFIPLDWLNISRLGIEAWEVALLAEFPPPPRVATPGFITDFLGLRTSSGTVGHPAGLDGRLLDPPVPLDFHADVVEWVAFIKVVQASRGRLVMAELGAGWGPWTAAAHSLARRLGIPELRLHAIEADRGHFDRMQRHLAENGVPAEILYLRHAALTDVPGDKLWPSRTEAGADYGARPMAEGGRDYRGFVPDGHLPVPGLPLTELLAEEPVWDLIHMDLQGLEEQLCRAAMPELTARVRHMIVATHSKALDAACCGLFHEAGWDGLNNCPPLVRHDRRWPELEAMTLADGLQLWRNPRLAG